MQELCFGLLVTLDTQQREVQLLLNALNATYKITKYCAGLLEEMDFIRVLEEITLKVNNGEVYSLAQNIANDISSIV